ncbi:cysteine hydrolase family protein [Nonomuraea sp. NPDC050790]|uniref:cysteine hydrolase family protein n=1 Tax=Nonomuraea sp. NPDC050790 TaxID=3364371 RepID=UPI0037BD09ED
MSATDRTTVLVMDMFNPYDHEDAERLTGSVEKILPSLARLVDEAAERPEVEIIYVNDNHGDFSAGPADLRQRAIEGRRPDLVEPLPVPAGCAFLPKVRHSAFFGTPLEYLLRREDIGTLVLAGQVTEQCVLYTALDAYVREFAVRVAEDCVAHIHGDLAEAAIQMMHRNMSATVMPGHSALGS